MSTFKSEGPRSTTRVELPDNSTLGKWGFHVRNEDGPTLTVRLFPQVGFSTTVAAFLAQASRWCERGAWPTNSIPRDKSGSIVTSRESVLGRRDRRESFALYALGLFGEGERKSVEPIAAPGFAKFVVVKKPARPAREGINPFTKEKQKFAAKPASKGVRARAVKAIKDAVG
jgi:DNA-binding protein HU-beta